MPVYRLCSRSIPGPGRYLQEYGLLANLPDTIHLIDPLGYLDMIRLMESAQKILTDSGGIRRRHTCWEYPALPSGKIPNG